YIITHLLRQQSCNFEQQCVIGSIVRNQWNELAKLHIVRRMITNDPDCITVPHISKIIKTGNLELLDIILPNGISPSFMKSGSILSSALRRIQSHDTRFTGTDMIEYLKSKNLISE